MSSEWISVKTKLPFPCSRVLVIKPVKMSFKRFAYQQVIEYIGVQPADDVADDGIIYWKPLGDMPEGVPTHSFRMEDDPLLGKTYGP